MSELFIESTLTCAGNGLTTTACAGHSAGPLMSVGGCSRSMMSRVELLVLSVISSHSMFFSTVRLAGLLLHSTVNDIPGTTSVELPAGAPQLAVVLQLASAILNAPVSVMPLMVYIPGSVRVILLPASAAQLLCAPRTYRSCADRLHTASTAQMNR